MKKYTNIWEYIQTNYAECKVDLEISTGYQLMLNNIFADEKSLVYRIYKNYDLSCFNFLEGGDDGFLFDSLALIGDLESLRVLNKQYGISKDLVLITNGEANYFTFYNQKNGKVYFSDFYYKNNLEEHSERIWNSFEDFLMEYLDLDESMFALIT